jgi:hypothetical protein
VRKQCLARVFFFWTKEFLNGRESIEDELRSGRSVMVRTEENKTNWRTGSQWSSTRADSERKTTDVVQFAVVASWQCAYTFCLPSKGVFGQEKYHCYGTSTLLAGSCPPATYFCSPESRTCSKGSILATLTGLKVIRRSLWMGFQKMTSRHTSNHGKHVCSGVYMRKETASKVTIFNCNKFGK